MQPLNETIVNTNESVLTEDRFGLRKFIEQLTTDVNFGNFDEFANTLDESFTAEGFRDYPLFKQQFKQRVIQRMSPPNSFIRIPKLSASFNQMTFVLKGTYEEFQEGIITTEGNIDLFIAKVNDKFIIIKMHFYPRMLFRDLDE